MYIHAVELYFNDTLERRVIDIWKSLAQSGITTSMLDITCVNPHITLAVFQDCNSDGVIPSLKNFAARTDEGELERIELVKVAIPDDHISSCSPVISLPFKKGIPSAR